VLEYLPAPQLAQAAPVVAENRPAAHGVHATLPVPGVTVPGGQAVQLELVVEYVPDGQAVQLVAPVAAK
jgi:hypothetical protein